MTLTTFKKLLMTLTTFFHSSAPFRLASKDASRQQKSLAVRFHAEQAIKLESINFTVFNHIVETKYVF